MTAAETAATLSSPRASAAARTGRAAAGHQPARPDERHPGPPARHAAPALRHVISISSGAGLVAFEYSSAYAASKFGLESWMGALEQEITPFGDCARDEREQGHAADGGPPDPPPRSLVASKHQLTRDGSYVRRGRMGVPPIRLVPGPRSPARLSLLTCW